MSSFDPPLNPSWLIKKIFCSIIGKTLRSGMLLGSFDQVLQDVRLSGDTQL